MEEVEKRAGRLVIVSNRLPVSVERTEDGFAYHPSVGGLATSLAALREQQEMLWIGWPGLTTDDPAEQAEIEERLRQEFNALPLFLPPETFELFYLGFSNRTIWPLFHYFTQYAHYEVKEWEAYREINELFAQKLSEIVQPDDRLWIQDYQLMLLPMMVRRRHPEVTIGFFLHIPFPSSEIFRILPWREAVLEGLLGADLIGFHSFNYARHFFSSLLRLMGLEQEYSQVIVDGRPVRADTFPLGIDVERFRSAHEYPAVQHRVAELHQQTQERKIVLSVDRLDFTKGILERMKAFEAFLLAKPEWQEQVSLITLCVPSRTDVPEYASLKRQVDEMVGRINGRFGRPGWVPIWYLYRSLPFEELAPLYLISDVALVTPLRDGMNLVAKEYLATRADGTGVLVLSETAGSAEELGEALIVNPHDREEIVAALNRALTMPVEEQKTRNRPMLERLKRYDTRRWAEDFLSQLERMRRIRPRYQQKSLEGERWEALLEAYRQAERRLLLLDYDGTLLGFVSRAELAEPDEELRSLLRRLASDSRNTVVVISGRDHVTLQSWLGDLGVHLVGEHGARFRWKDSTEWELVSDAAGDEWQEQIRPVLEVYVDRTPGAHLEDKGTSLVWHYRMAEPELGSIRAMELMNTLEGYIVNTPLHVMQGNKVVEVKPSEVNKGRAARRWLRTEPHHNFILAIGDDVTDEDTFSVLPEGSWAVKVGAATQSRAGYDLPGPEDVRRLLAAMLETASKT